MITGLVNAVCGMLLPAWHWKGQTMELRDLWTNLRHWRTKRTQQQEMLNTVDEDGLISTADAESMPADEMPEKTPKPEAIVKKSARFEKKEEMR